MVRVGIQRDPRKQEGVPCLGCLAGVTLTEGRAGTEETPLYQHCQGCRPEEVEGRDHSPSKRGSQENSVISSPLRCWSHQGCRHSSTFLHLSPTAPVHTEASGLPEHGHPTVGFFPLLFPPLCAFQILTGEDRDKLGLLVALERLSRLYDVSWVSAVEGIKECCFYGCISFQLTF